MESVLKLVHDHEGGRTDSLRRMLSKTMETTPSWRSRSRFNDDRFSLIRYLTPIRWAN